MSNQVSSSSFDKSIDAHTHNANVGSVEMNSGMPSQKYIAIINIAVNIGHAMQIKYRIFMYYNFLSNQLSLPSLISRLSIIKHTTIIHKGINGRYIGQFSHKCNKSNNTPVKIGPPEQIKSLIFISSYFCYTNQLHYVRC